MTYILRNPCATKMAKPNFTTMADLTGEPSNSEAHGLNKSMFLLCLGASGFRLAFDPCENNLYYTSPVDQSIGVVTLKTSEKKVVTKIDGTPVRLAVDWMAR